MAQLNINDDALIYNQLSPVHEAVFIILRQALKTEEKYANSCGSAFVRIIGR